MYTLDINTITHYLKSDATAVSVLEPLLAQDVALNIRVYKLMLPNATQVELEKLVGIRR